MGTLFLHAIIHVALYASSAKCSAKVHQQVPQADMTRLIIKLKSLSENFLLLPNQDPLMPNGLWFVESTVGQDCLGIEHK